MKEGLLQLLKLQEVDKELEALEEAKDKYPAEISERQAEIDDSGRALLTMETEKADWEKKQRHSEREIESSKTNLKVHEERFAVVTTNKEYDALQMEIEACKAGIAEHESQYLNSIEAIQNLEEGIESEKESFEQVRQLQQERIDELQGQLDSMQELVDGVDSRRTEVANTIEKRMLTIYERRRGPRSKRVSAVRKGACGACYRQLPPQQRSEVRRGDKIMNCENCNSIMVWDDDSE
jgi:predicted  nucleic acid-binding Zn-ribbon protein